jgi:hypothetical protein
MSPASKDVMANKIVATILTLVCAGLMPASAAGQEPVAPDVLQLPAASNLHVRMTAPPEANWWPVVPVSRPPRGPVLLSLYAAQVGLQAYDGYSTTQGLSNGATESNDLLRGLAHNRAALWSVKAGAAFVSVYAAEKLWRRHRRGQAIAVMIVSNGVMAAVAMNNAAVLRGQR